MNKGGFARVLCVLAAATWLPATGCTGEPGPAGEAGPPGPAGPAGPPGTEGDTPTQSISAVLPGKAFLERTVDVTISGSGTRWTQAATVDFGPGIKIESVTVASPSAIIATVTVSATAMRNARDVSVTDGTDKVTYKGAFKIEAPIASRIEGTAAQGSVFFVSVDQRDLFTPFDLTGADGKEDSYPNLQVSVSGAEGLDLSIDDAQTYNVRLLGFLDVGAPPGGLDLRIMSGPEGAVTSSLAPTGITIAERAPIPLYEGMPLIAAVTDAYESQLHEFTAPGKDKLITFSVQSNTSSPDGEETKGRPLIALLPESGRFDDYFSFGPEAGVVTTGADKYYAIVYDLSGEKGYDYTLTVKTADSDEREPNNACNAAQPIAALPAELHNLALASKTDQDWFAITATDVDVGKTVHVVTSAGDPLTDTEVAVFTGDCKTPLGDPQDDFFHEDFKSDPIPAAGTYYVSVTSPIFGTEQHVYNLAISLE